jgi:hypothetical protein
MSDHGALDRLSELFARTRRAEPRYSVLLAGRAIAASCSGPVTIRDLSLSGALLDGPSLPPLGRLLILKRGPFEIAGRIAWRKGNRAGLRFERPLAAEALSAIVGRARNTVPHEAIAA